MANESICASGREPQGQVPLLLALYRLQPIPRSEDVSHKIGWKMNDIVQGLAIGKLGMSELKYYVFVRHKRVLN